eukprot:GFUD01131671.1.p1 GENE.GFUD01131671.1~~GFUD01131671.1.p1  ORF type:complete len:772 (+),score=293.82 GFUD01131671.1:35-2350(+)
MDLLAGTHLLRSGQQLPVKQALEGKQVLAFYFSAHWCPPCRQFTPALAQAYRQSRQAGQGGGVEVIFVSSDRSQTDMTDYMKESHADWLAVPFGSPCVQALSSQLGVRGIPALKVVGRDGSIISDEGRQEVMAMGTSAFAQWEMLAPAEVDTSTVELLRENTEEVRKEAADILVKLLSNIVAEPGNTKYRQLKLANKTIEEKLLPASGAFEILFSVGFEEAEDKLVLPLGADVKTVEKFRDAIKNIDSASEVVEAVSAQPVAAAPGPSSQTSALLLPGVLTRERQFLDKLVSCLAHMDTYEDAAAQAKAIAVMPVELFNTTARTKFEAARRTNPEVTEDLFKDILLLEFKEWFKTDFFSWVDSPPCPVCGSATQSRGLCVATSQEQQDGAGRVEGYKCVQCGLQEVRFPRYHSRPEKLLETRRGRCGEWANCFVLCCRALGFDTRHVVDWTDHVWAEVWSKAEGRWLHVDPGETVDKTLVYEAGWGKKLTYVVAFSKDEVQDVTWRYSKNHEDTKNRRTLVRPMWLVRNILQLTGKRQLRFSEEEKSRLMSRRLTECLEMLTARSVGEGDRIGRQTGSLAWRLARGEVGEIKSEYVFIPSEEEVEEGVMEVEYDCAEDKYFRTGRKVVKEGFMSAMFSSKNVARKVESDWNMVYVARMEGNCDKGEVTWKFRMAEGTEVGKVQLMVGSSCYSTGVVTWTLCSDRCCVLPPAGEQLETEQLAGSGEIQLTARLGGGEGESAWQHSQLFRCSKDGPAGLPQMKITIWFKKSGV